MPTKEGTSSVPFFTSNHKSILDNSLDGVEPEGTIIINMLLLRCLSDVSADLVKYGCVHLGVIDV